jgi:hypothetical protein
MSLVLAIEPDLRQATILKRIIRDKVHADVAVVESPDAALAAIGTRMPDVLLLSALLSPRDEDELIAHLRGLDGAEHIQTHTIPQLASTAADQEPGARRGLLGVFKRKKEAAQPIVSGCDPDLFADEIATFIQRAAEKKAEGVAALQSRVDQLEYQVQSNRAPETHAETTRPHEVETTEHASDAEPASSWSSPFEWRKSPESRVSSPESQVSSPESQVPSPESYVPSPESQVSSPESYVPSPESYAASHTEPIGLEAHDLGLGTSDSSTPTDSDVTLIDGHDARLYGDGDTQESTPAVHLHIVEEPGGNSGVAAGNGTDRHETEQRAPRRRNKVAAATLLRLTPLAMWARTEAAHATPVRVATPEPQTAAEELRHLMANLAVPPHVAGVSYGRGCRIRRVRVPGGKERRRADAPGPVILSKRALDRQREANQ